MPNISACALASDGRTAKLVWGSRAGDVLFINVPRAMENGGRRSAAEVKKSSASDEHNGAVLDVTWIDVQVGWVITGGADARIKIWDAKDATNVYPVLKSLVSDPCIKVPGSARHGYVVCV
jgi:WD40 repeat protein